MISIMGIIGMISAIIGWVVLAGRLFAEGIGVSIYWFMQFCAQLLDILF